MQRKWCQVSQIPMAQEGGSKARPPLALELEISIHFDLGALDDVLISARQNDWIMALANLALESVTLPQRLTATMILSKCELYHDGGCKYALPYFPTGIFLAGRANSSVRPALLLRPNIWTRQSAHYTSASRP